MSSGIARVLAPVLALAVVASGVAAAESRTAPGPTEEDRGGAIFFAPFASQRFLAAVQEEVERRRIAEERITGVFVDERLDLVWAAEDNGRDIDWRRAQEYCDALELAGFDDWHLPSLEELETLLRPLSRQQYSTPNEIELTACCPWSSTPKNDFAAWNFNFRFRKRFSGSMTHTYDLRALCVRPLLEGDGLPEEPEEESEQD